MKKLLTINFAVLILLLFAFTAFAQTNAKLEQELISAIKEVRKYSSYGGNSDDEKLSKANEIFEAKLLKYTKIAATLKYPFAELNKLMSNATSADGRFRVYTWDSETGGTMHDFSRVYQYLGADEKIYSQTEANAEQDGGAGSFAYDIFTVNGRDGKIYAVCSTFIGDTQDHYDSADLYKIEGASLKDKIKMIKTNAGMTDTLHFEYNPFSLADRRESLVRLINFNPKTQTLTIPVVINDKEFPNGRVTDKFISYRFDGTYFVKTN